MLNTTVIGYSLLIGMYVCMSSWPLQTKQIRLKRRDLHAFSNKLK